MNDPCDLGGWIAGHTAQISDLILDIRKDFGLDGANFEPYRHSSSRLEEELAAIWTCLDEIEQSVNYGDSVYYGSCGY
jgi:hypothetical protein